MQRCIGRLNEYLRGWMDFFGICTSRVEYVLGGLDAHIRRRLRAIQLRHWKRKRTIVLRGEATRGNSQPRRAVCEPRKYGSVRGAPGDRGPYSTTRPRTDAP